MGLEDGEEGHPPTRPHSLSCVCLPHFWIASVKVSKHLWLQRRPWDSRERLALLDGTLASAWNCPALGVLKPDGWRVCGTSPHTLPTHRDESMAVKRKRIWGYVIHFRGRIISTWYKEMKEEDMKDNLQFYGPFPSVITLDLQYVNGYFPCKPLWSFFK